MRILRHRYPGRVVFIERRNTMKSYLNIIFPVALICSLACGGQTSNGQEDRNMSASNEDIRPAILAGRWYEADPDNLRSMVDLYLKYAKISHDLGKITGLISPHAGYQYSGQVAAYAYKQVQGKHYDTVVVIAPNHADPRLNFSSVMTHGGYTTPLGIMTVDEEIARAIADFDAFDNVRESDIGHLTRNLGNAEHSLEIQLPFLQVALGDFELVPILMGDQSEKSCTVLANAITAAVKDKNVLLVGSTDLSHFFNDEKARQLDSVVQKHVEAFDPEGLMRDIELGKCQACGGAHMAAIMMACKQLGAKKSTVLHMANSGDVTGDKSSVVGYLSAALSVSGDDGDEVGVNLGLSEQEKKVLKNVVKQTLEIVVNGGGIPRYNNLTGKLGEEWGAFVTLTKNGELRGCIGHIIGTQPLITTVSEMTKAAAMDDPRFSNVSPSELPDIEFEISVLTPIREIKDINEIVVGRDGIIISKGMYRGLLLPQVATDYGWDRNVFLEQTCRKAGLPTGAWKDKDTKIEIFSAEIIK